MSVISRALVAATIALVAGSTVGAQEARPPLLSPRDSVVQTVGDGRVVVDYGMKDGFGVLRMSWDTTQASVPFRVLK